MATLASARSMPVAKYINPHFPVTPELIRSEAVRLRANPVPLARPIMILGGWRAPAISPWRLEDRLRRLLPGATIITIAYPLAGSIEAARGEVERRLSRAKLQRAADGALELDVIGISMGGLVARTMLSTPLKGVPNLRVPRLFTLATPHRGAVLTRHVRPDSATKCMREDSEFLAKLNATAWPASTSLTCYTLLHDWWVGARNTAPPGRTPIWLDASNVAERWMSHFLIVQHAGIATDIARRLRGEAPLSVEGAPPPID